MIKLEFYNLGFFIIKNIELALKTRYGIIEVCLNLFQKTYHFSLYRLF